MGKRSTVSRKFTVVHHRVLRWNLVVIVRHPSEDLVQELHALCWIRMQSASQLRLFGKRQLLQRPGFRAVRNAHCAVHVDTAQHHHTSRHAAEDVHQLFRLRTRTDHKINHHVGSKALQFLSAGAELVAVTPNLLHVGWRRRGAAVKYSQHLSSLFQCSHDEPTDEAIPAN